MRPLSSLQDLRPPVFDLAEGLEEPVQLLYIVTLLGFAAFGAYLVVRQVLIRRDLEEAAKVLGERIRSGDGNSEVSCAAKMSLRQQSCCSVESQEV